MGIWRFSDLSHDFWRKHFFIWRLTFWRWLFTWDTSVNFDLTFFFFWLALGSLEIMAIMVETIEKSGSFFHLNNVFPNSEILVQLLYFTRGFWTVIIIIDMNKVIMKKNLFLRLLYDIGSSFLNNLTPILRKNKVNCL